LLLQAGNGLQNGLTQGFFHANGSGNSAVNCNRRDRCAERRRLLARRLDMAKPLIRCGLEACG